MSKEFFILKRLLIIFVIMTGTVVLVLAYQWIKIMKNGELGLKPVYAILQGVEYNYRKDVDKYSVIEIYNINKSGYDVIGIPTGDRIFPRTWVILNKTVGGKVIFIPGGASEIIKCDYVSKLSDKKNIDKKVIDFLMQKCQK